MRRLQVKHFRSCYLVRQPFSVPVPGSCNVAIAGDHQSWSLDLSEEISVIHIAEGCTTSQIANGICAQEDGADRSDMWILFRQSVRREEPLHCLVNDRRHSAFAYGCNSRFPIRARHELR